MGKLLNPAVPTSYAAAKFKDQIAFSTAVGFATAFMSFGLWVWDWAVDSVHAPSTLPLRLLMAAVMLAYPVASVAGLNRRHLFAVLMACGMGAELILGAIVNRLDGGAAQVNGGFLFFFFMPIVLALPFSFRANALAMVGLFVVPLVASLFDLPKGLDRTIFVALNGPGSAISIFCAFVLDRLLLRNYQNQLEIQRLGELALQQSQRQYRSIFEGAIEGIFQVSTSGRFLAANPALAALLGYPSSPELIAALPGGFYQAWAEADELQRFREALEREGQVRGYACRIRSPAGSLMWCLVSARLIRDAEGRPASVEGFVQDVTEQRAAAQAREQALAAAEDLVRLRREFLANMSHEIRTPLNGVLGFARIGQRHCHDVEKARDAFAKIEVSGERLLGVINDILDFSRIEAGKLHIERSDVVLAELIGQALDLVREHARAKGLELRVELAPDLPQHCLCDPLRLRQILLNLLSNAVKFTPAGSVTLSARRQASALAFEVRDTGIGMDSEQLQLLFDPFQQADGSVTRRFSGTGLGLAITRRLLELMNGQIRVQSQPGVGSSFEFQLPCS